MAKVEISERTLSIIAFGAAMASMVFSLFVFAQWKVSERETRMLEYYIMELDGKLMATGVIKSPESWSARKEKDK